MIKRLFRHILFILLLITGSTVFAEPRMEYERIYIHNETSRNLFFSFVYSDDPDKVFTPEERVVYLSWRQRVYGVNLNVYTNYRENKREYVILPGANKEIIYYYPASNLDGYDAWIRLDQISFMDKMRSFYKSLRIATSDGKIDITLESLGEQLIKKPSSPYRENGRPVNDISYSIYIFDDYSRRPVPNSDLGIMVRPASNYNYVWRRWDACRAERQNGAMQPQAQDALVQAQGGKEND